MLSHPIRSHSLESLSRLAAHPKRAGYRRQLLLIFAGHTGSVPYEELSIIGYRDRMEKWYNNSLKSERMIV